MRMRNKSPPMILEFAIADAYAQAFEYVKDPKSHGLVNDGKTFQQNPKYSDLKPGNFTDDTIRTICSASMVLSTDVSVLYNPKKHFFHLRQYFFKLYRKGWSGRFQSFMEENKDKDLDTVYNKIQRRDTNGAIMGILPFGYLPSVSEVKDIAAAHATSTHSASTIPYAQATALCIWYLRNHKNNKKEALNLKDFLLDSVEELHIFKGNPDNMKASDTFNVVLTQVENAVKNEKYMFQVLRDCVALGGDTDTIASLTAGIYSKTREHNFFGDDYFISKLEEIESGNTETQASICELEENLEQEFRLR